MKTLHMIGNAHLDLAWIWPWQEGFGEVKATFASALARMDEFDDFLFSSASALYFRWLEDNAPELFKRVSERVKQGRIALCGGWWVQPDCNLPCAESFVRQALHGQQYFLSRFNKLADIGYNVDSFGHSFGLPQILQKSGARGYVFLRPGEHELALPSGAFWWEGADGSRIMACRIPVNYSSLTGLEEHILEVLKRFPESSRHFLCFYGVGNHGGGPTIQNIQHIQQHQHSFPGVQLRLSTPSQYFDDVTEAKASLPIHRSGLKHHAVGCYSALSAIKQLNRKAEHSLLRAEKAISFARMFISSPTIPGIAHHHWENLLQCQFHDILAGVCIREVYDDALARLGGVCAAAEDACNHALQALSFQVDLPFREGAIPLVVFNPHSWPITAEITHEKGSWGNPGFPDPCVVTDGSGNVLPHQFIRVHASLDERQRIVFRGQLPALGYQTFWISPCDEASEPAKPACAQNILENDFVRVVFSTDTGLMISCFDKTVGREYLRSPSARFYAVEDHSDSWSHGLRRYDGTACDASFVRMDCLEEGPVLKRLQIIHRYDHSLLRQVFTLYADSPVLEAEAEINWQEPFRCLKLCFELALDDPLSCWEVPFGTEVRPVDGQEEPMQSWISVSQAANSEQGFGMAIAANGKGGAHVSNSQLALTVLRSVPYAHHAPNALKEPFEALDLLDMGLQTFRYCLIPHPHGWRKADVPKHALTLNQPPLKVVETYHHGALPSSACGICISSSNVLVSCLKPAYDGNGLILRLFETDGIPTPTDVCLPLMQIAFQTSFHPFEAKTFRLNLTERSAMECDLLEQSTNNT